nr:DnaA N-terminal domain-containing protein [uncultured Emticicia sp.]
MNTHPNNLAKQFSLKKSVNFLNAELDLINSSYKMLMYREGFSHPNTYYSKKKHFAEPQDKEYLMLSMIERFIGRNNCFFRKHDQLNGKTYSPATMIEFWRIFQDDTEERLVLRMFHPTTNVLSYEVFDYLIDNFQVKSKLNLYYELMRVGKTEAIGVSKPRYLEQDELTDFTWKKMSKQEFAKHLAHLYTKYPSRNRIDIYKHTYMNRYFYEANALTENRKPLILTDEKVDKNVSSVWAKCLEFICLNVDNNAFLTWFVPIIPLKLENERLLLQLPSTFFYHWIEENYVDLLRKTIDYHIGQDTNLEYVVL